MNIFEIDDSVGDRVIPAKVYDAIKASADKCGGVGSGTFTRNGAPNCLFGHARAVSPKLFAYFGNFKYVEVLRSVELNVFINDTAVDQLQGPKEITAEVLELPHERVPFDMVAKRLKLVRGT